MLREHLVSVFYANTRLCSKAFLTDIIVCGAGGVFMGFLRLLLALVFVAAALFFVGGGILDGYFGTSLFPEELEPDSWTAPDSWSEWRDIMIVLMGFFWALALLLLVVFLAALVFLALMVRRILKENAAPAIDSLKGALDNVKGTAEFAGETVVSPIIRVYSVFAGVRSGIGAIGNLPSRIRGQRKRSRK